MACPRNLISVIHPAREPKKVLEVGILCNQLLVNINEDRAYKKITKYKNVINF
jgi:hypothetical protein